MSVRVRFAPSPTGFLHVGGARTALFNWLLARQTGGVFVLRIEDTDRDRSSDEMTEAILTGLEWLGLTWDEGPFHQADGFDRHRSDVERLLSEGKAYRCFCSPQELQARRDLAEASGAGAYRYDKRCAQHTPSAIQAKLAAGEPHAIRFSVPTGETEWDDMVHGQTRFQNDDLDDFIILRTDGTPIYNLAVVSDDIAMEITHVLRGDDHLSNTPRQILLYRALGAAEPRFAHLPMILGGDGKRLSKRHGATSVGEYQSMGILPQALLNFLALLGWNPGDEQEVMEEHELISRFSVEKINKKSAVFDVEKLEWMNGQHIMRMSAHDLLALMKPELLAGGLTTEQEMEDRADWFADMVELLKPRSRTVSALVEQSRLFLAPQVEYDPAAVEKNWTDPEVVVKRLRIARDAFAALDDWRPDAIETALREAAEREGLGFGKLVHPLRLALTGTLASPGIDQVVWLLGRDVVGQRIADAEDFLGRSAGRQT